MVDRGGFYVFFQVLIQGRLLSSQAGSIEVSIDESKVWVKEE